MTYGVSGCEGGIGGERMMVMVDRRGLWHRSRCMVCLSRGVPGSWTIVGQRRVSYLAGFCFLSFPSSAGLNTNYPS